MDLQEWVKKGNVWKLESEAFKKPIEIKIWYDNHELAEFQKEVLWLKWQFDNHDKQLALQLETQWLNNENFAKINKAFNDKQHQLNELSEKELDDRKEIRELYKVIADQKTTIETLSGTMLRLQEQMKELEKKITKQPIVFHDKCFISWRESCGLWWVYDIPDWEYLMLLNIKIWEHNEYVTNQDELLMDKIHVSWHYVQFYKLEWGTELDTPTATIYYDLVFIPI